LDTSGKKKNMATKIRLQRHGRKKSAFFHLVVVDSRAPRDGRFIEKIGTYNPVTNPATIDIDLNRAVEWLMTGATPTDTANAILSYKGALYKKHLQVGVKKGAITQEQADANFATWLTEKENSVQNKRDGLANAKSDADKAAMKAETARKVAIAAKVLAKTSELEAEIAAETETKEEPTEVATEEVTETAEVAAEVVAETAEVVAEPVLEAETAEETAPEVEAAVAVEAVAETAEKVTSETTEETPG